MKPTTKNDGTGEGLRAEIARFPVIYRGAEALVAGLLMRRNILTYPAPPLNEGYDLLCIHPNPRLTTRTIRVQVKSRMATDSGGFYVNSRTFDAFNYLIIVVMNLGYHYRGPAERIPAGVKHPDLYVLPVAEVKHRTVSGKRERILFGSDRAWLAKYSNERGIEQIARDLHVPFPLPPRFVGTRLTMRNGVWRASTP